RGGAEARASGCPPRCGWLGLRRSYTRRAAGTAPSSAGGGDVSSRRTCHSAPQNSILTAPWWPSCHQARQVGVVRRRPEQSLFVHEDFERRERVAQLAPLQQVRRVARVAAALLVDQKRFEKDETSGRDRRLQRRKERALQVAEVDDRIVAITRERKRLEIGLDRQYLQPFSTGDCGGAA